jgi:hypothetical protein
MRSRVSTPSLDVPQPVFSESMNSALAEIEEALADLAERGIICDTGQRRNGRVVWMFAPYGKRLAEIPSEFFETSGGDAEIKH